jgi:hypothetical protein
MAVLDKKTFNQIVELLEPFANTSTERRLLVTSAFMGIATPPDIDYEGASLAVRERIVISLVEHGKVERIGTQAIWLLLQHIHPDVGVEQQQCIDGLHNKLNVQTLQLHRGILTAKQPDKLTFEQENRKRLIDNVQRSWIDGVLNDALRDAELDIAAKNVPERVQNARFPHYTLPLNVFQQQGNKLTMITSAGDIIGKVFHDVDGKLLILGAPGSGKTVLLLQLAQTLLNEATPLNDAPIPIIINLSSWAIKREDMQDWIVEELQRPAYGVPKKLAQQLVGMNKLIFLLDGLDEVAEVHRDACVAAINDFMTDDRQLTICSRVEEYENLAEKLDTYTALQVQPLTDEQAKAYLSERLQPEMVENIVSVLQADEEVWQEVNKPLFINILISTYHDRPVTALPSISGNTIKQVRQLVIEPYIKRQLENAPTDTPYDHDSTRRYLGWLGFQMNKRELTTFHVEHLQADWYLEHGIWRFKVLSVIISGLIFALIVALIYWLIFALVEVNIGLINWLMYILTNGLIYALVYVLIGGLKAINLEQKLTVKRPEKSDLIGGLRYGLIVAGIFGLFGALIDALMDALTYGLIFVMLSGLIGGLRSGLSGKNPISLRAYPNQGLVDTLIKGLSVWLIFGLLIMLIIMLIFIPFPGLSFRLGSLRIHLAFDEPSHVLIFGLSWGLIFGLIFGLVSGLSDVNKHLILRGLLLHKQVVPRRYDKFLYYAKDRRLMRQVGGGFIFLHRYLLEYFADWYERKYGKPIE